MQHAIELTPTLTSALKEIAEGKSHLFITGKAGTGKSTLLRYYCAQQSTTPIILAPTGIAALNVHGQTIHRFFKFRPDTDIQKISKSRLTAYEARLYRNLKEIIIDEISMVRADLLDCIDVFLRKYGPLPEWPFGGVRLIMFGDMHQLPPVVTSATREFIYSQYSTPYFFSAHALQGEKLRIIELDKIFRQTDDTFIALLNAIRSNAVDRQSFEMLNARHMPLSTQRDDPERIIITGTNAHAQRINAHYLSKVTGEEYALDALVEGEFKTADYPTNKNIIIKKGARIILLNNDQSDRWVNGSMATIMEISEVEGELVIYGRIDETQEIVQIERHTWGNFRYIMQKDAYDSEEIGSFNQFPFRLAWAITVHKSQGKTFTKVHIDLGHRAFAAGQTYVALSRCRTLDDLSLERHLTTDDVYVDETLGAFFKQVAHTGTVNTQKQRRMPIAEIEALLLRSIDKEETVRIEYIHLNGHVGLRTVRTAQVSHKTYQGRAYQALEGFCMETEKHCIFDMGNIMHISVVAPAE